MSEKIVIPKGSIAIWDAQHPLANFAEARIVINDGRVEVPTSEHFYQMIKFYAWMQTLRQEIRTAPTPLDAKRIATAHAAEIRPHWDLYKYNAMKGTVRLKLRQNPAIRAELRATGKHFIYEHADMFAPANPDETQIADMRRWGIYQEEGQNWMGKILMELRVEFALTGWP